MIVIRQSIVIFLILLQFVAPLLHAHSDAELSTDSLHVPGLELVNIRLSHAKTLEPLYHQADGFIVGVCKALNHFNEIINADFHIAHIYKLVFPTNHQNPSLLVSFQPDVFYPKPPLVTNNSRAPPYI